MLKDTDRLTIRHAGDTYRLVRGGYTKYWTQASKFALMDRLGEYEDLHLTPEDIRDVVAEWCNLKAKEKEERENDV